MLKCVWLLYRVFQRIVSIMPGFKLLVARRPGTWIVGLVYRLSRARFPNPLVVKKLTLYWDRYGSTGLFLLSDGVYERDTVVLVEKFLGPGMTFVDLGANIGYFSLIGARCVGALGKVYAFEPNSQTYDLLVKNIEANGFQGIIRPVKKAVSNTVGSTSIYLGKKSCEQTGFYLTPLTRSKKVVVETTSMDAFFAAEDWPRVDLIKMDIEGAEKLALEGMEELARRNPSLKLIIEFAPDLQSTIGVAPEELIETISALGFVKISVITDSGLRPLASPKDIPPLIHMLMKEKEVCVNLFCER